MTIRLPHFRPDAPEVTGTPFVIRARDLRVVDGDTVAALLPRPAPRQGRQAAFRVRFRSADAGETREKFTGPETIVLRSVGLADENGPGARAAADLKWILTGRSVLVIPHGLDRWGRIVGDVWASGCEGDSFGMRGAWSAERRMIEMGSLSPREGEPVPSSLEAELARAIDDPPAFDDLHESLSARERDVGPGW